MFHELKHATPSYEERVAQEMERKISALAQERDYTTHDFSAAYKAFLLREDVDDRIAPIVALFKESERKGLPINHQIIRLGYMANQERAIVERRFDGAIDALSLTDREKSLLRSIVEERRAGVLTVDFSNGESIDIPIDKDIISDSDGVVVIKDAIISIAEIPGIARITFHAG